MKTRPLAQYKEIKKYMRKTKEQVDKILDNLKSDFFTFCIDELSITNTSFQSAHDEYEITEAVSKPLYQNEIGEGGYLIVMFFALTEGGAVTERFIVQKMVISVYERVVVASTNPQIGGNGEELLCSIKGDKSREWFDCIYDLV